MHHLHTAQAMEAAAVGAARWTMRIRQRVEHYAVDGDIMRGLPAPGCTFKDVEQKEKDWYEDEKEQNEEAVPLERMDEQSGDRMNSPSLPSVTTFF